MGKRAIDWTNFTFLAVIHAVGVVGTAVCAAAFGVPASALVTAIVLAGLSIFGISAGYHRLFSHRTYEAHPVFKVFLLLFGASSFQTSALEWSANHRRHHARTDTEEDPYSVREGFWHAHIGWVIKKVPRTAPTMALADLRSDRWVMWQDRHFVPLALAMTFGLPLALGFAFGAPLMFLLVGGFARLVFVYQATFSINSLAHMVGAQPYSTKDSSRDSFWIALFTSGEGYHNYHHTFPGDYRNGVRAHQFDPTKWILFGLNALGVVKKLRRTPAAAVLRARLRTREEAAQRVESKSIRPALVLPALRARPART